MKTVPLPPFLNARVTFNVPSLENTFFEMLKGFDFHSARRIAACKEMDIAICDDIRHNGPGICPNPKCPVWGAPDAVETFDVLGDKVVPILDGDARSAVEILGDAARSAKLTAKLKGFA